jgi:hypothetical protein
MIEKGVIYNVLFFKNKQKKFINIQSKVINLHLFDSNESYTNSTGVLDLLLYARTCAFLFE